MATSFNSYVTDPNLYDPSFASQTYGLSAFGVGIVSLGSNVKAIAFNNNTNLATNQKKLSAAGRDDNPDGFEVNINVAYHGADFAVIYKNNSSRLFTANTASNTAVNVPAKRVAQTVTSADFNVSTPDSRRKWLLGY